MKKILTLAALAVLFASCGSSKKTMEMQNQMMMQQQYATPQRDPIQTLVDDYSKDGYKPYGAYSMYTLYELISRTRDLCDSDSERYSVIEGIGEGNDLTSSKMFALAAASMEYATKAGSSITGQMNLQFSNLTESTRTKIAGAYTQKVSEFIMPTMKENYTISRMNGNKIEYRVSYLIDETKAANARKAAIDETLKAVAQEVALEQAFMDSVSNFVESNAVQ